MERIRLTKEEKVLFRRFSRKDISIPEDMSEGAFNYAATGLEDKELIYTEWKLTTLSHAGLTPKGSAYLSLNPKQFFQYSSKINLEFSNENATFVLLKAL